MAERALRGTRLGATSYENDRNTDLAPRQEIAFDCPKGHHFSVPFAAEERIRDPGPERPRLLDLRAAENAPVARRKRLRDRRGGAEHVDDDAEPGRSGLLGGEGDVKNRHLTTLLRT